jgi:hypothetical protein
MAQAGDAAEDINIGQPNVARMYDFLLGGQHHFAADRAFGRRLLAAEPNARLIVAENRAFMRRAVRFLAGTGVRQFIDLGSGIPVGKNVHEIARRGNPGARIVYVDSDPVVIAHGRQVLADDRFAVAVHADLRDADAVLGHPQVKTLIDPTEPVGLLMINVLSFVPDGDDPVGTVGRFAEYLAAGSYLAISHSTVDRAPNAGPDVEAMYAGATARAQSRTRPEILRFFTGFDLVEPGLVYLPLWRPDGSLPENPERMWFYAGVGRKPKTAGAS